MHPPNPQHRRAQSTYTWREPTGRLHSYDRQKATHRATSRCEGTLQTRDYPEAAIIQKDHQVYNFWIRGQRLRWSQCNEQSPGGEDPIQAEQVLQV